MRLKAAFILIFFMLFSAGNLANAEDYLDFYEQGEFALAIEKWDRAIKLFSQSIQDNPNFFMAYHNRAIAYSKLGEYDKSVEDLKKAVQLIQIIRTLTAD
jgi:tetratricopeptide (TPR) repeat protein